MEYLIYNIIPNYIVPLMFISFGILCIIKPKMAHDIDSASSPISNYNELRDSKPYAIVGMILIFIGILNFLIANNIITITINILK